jgi:hypothetical protein
MSEVKEEAKEEVKEVKAEEKVEEADLADLLASTLNLPKDVVVKALSREDALQRAQALIQLLSQVSSLPKELRKVTAPLVANAMSSNEDEEFRRLAKWVAIMRALNDPSSTVFARCG